MGKNNGNDMTETVEHYWEQDEKHSSFIKNSERRAIPRPHRDKRGRGFVILFHVVIVCFSFVCSFPVASNSQVFDRVVDLDLLVLLFLC